MTPGQKVRIATLTAPHGTVFTSVEVEKLCGTVGEVKTWPDAAGYVAVTFPTVPDGDRMHLHTSMLTPTR